MIVRARKVEDGGMPRARKFTAAGRTPKARRARGQASGPRGSLRGSISQGRCGVQLTGDNSRSSPYAADG